MKTRESLALLKMMAQGYADLEQGKTLPARDVIRELNAMIDRDFPA